MCADDDLTKALEETTQIATKTRINADYVPGTVNIIKGEELKALGIMNLAQPNALDMIVGMESSVNALRGSGAVYGGQGVKIKWLINGKSVSSQVWSGSIWGRSSIVFPILVDQIDRIEIIRGPDSAIYGENAIFGVINIITKTQNNAIAVAGSYQGKDRSGKSIAANTSYSKDDFSLNLSVSAYQSDGYPLYVGKGGNFYSWVDASQQPAYGPGYLPNNNEGFTIFLDASYGNNRFWASRMRVDAAQGGFGTWYPTDPLPNDDGSLKQKTIFEQFGYARTFDLGLVNSELKIGYDTAEDSTNEFLRLGSDFHNAGFESIRSMKYKEVRKYISLDVDRQFDDHHILLGATAQKTTNVDDKRYGNYWYNWALNKPIEIPYGYMGYAAMTEDTNRLLKSIFFQDTWDLNDKTTVTYGARFDAYSGDIKSQGWSPRVALVYRLDEHNIFKAQYARAFRPPTYSEIDSAVSGMQASLKSETVDTIELGHIYKSGNITLKNTLFESRIYNMITFDDWTYYTINLPKVGKIQGFEMEGKYSVDSFELGFNQAFYKTRKESRDFVSPDASEFTYRYASGAFPLAPSYIANLFLKLNPNGAYPTTIWYHYVGGKTRKSEFTVNSNDNLKGGSNGETSAQDYLNITQQFKGIAKNLDLSIGVQNLFGKTQKTLYMPLNQPNNQDIPYMGQLFWANLSYKF